MSTIPNGISSDDLKALLATAHITEEDSVLEDDDIDLPTVKTAKGVFTSADIECLAQEADEWLFQKCPHPIAHKVMILQILDKMIQWHEKTALEKEGTEAAGWAADAGKLHAVSALFRCISMGQQDFTV